MGHLVPEKAAAKLQPAGAGAMPAGAVGVGAPRGGPPFSANDPRLSAVLQAERLDLLSSPKLVLE